MRPIQNVSRNMASKKSSIFSIIKKYDKINLILARSLKGSSKLSSQQSHLIDKGQIDHHKQHKSQVL